MNALIGFVTSFFTTFKQMLAWALDGCLYVLKAALYFAFDGLLTGIQGFFALIDVSSIASSAALNWAGLPPQLIYLVNQVGIPQGLSILAGAILIRMTVNLIPAAFTRI